MRISLQTFATGGNPECESLLLGCCSTPGKPTCCMGCPEVGLSILGRMRDWRPNDSVAGVKAVVLMKMPRLHLETDRSVIGRTRSEAGLFFAGSGRSG